MRPGERKKTLPEVVSNSGPLIALAEINRFPLLQPLFGELSIPSAVYTEVVVDGAGQPGAKETAEADWIKTGKVLDRLAVDLLRDELGPGQSETTPGSALEDRFQDELEGLSGRVGKGWRISVIATICGT